MSQGLGVQLGLGGGRSATSSGAPAGGGAAFDVYSVDFDGVDDYCAIGSSGNFGTFSAWIKPSSIISASSTVRNLIGFTGVAPWAAASGIGFGPIAGNLTNEIITIYTGDWIYGYTSASATISTEWHHLATRWSGSDYEIYLDGTQVKNADAQYGSASKANIAISSFNIGRRNPGNRFFDGLVDEVALWTTPLSAAEVIAIYNSGTPTDLTSYSPDGWWRMGDNNGGAGTTITDQGSGENDGTLTNGPAFSEDVP